MRLGPLTKLNDKNKTASKHFEDDTKLENCDFVIIFLIYWQLGVI